MRPVSEDVICRNMQESTDLCTWPVQKVSDIWPEKKNTYTLLEVCNPNPRRSSLLVTEHTSPSGSTIVRSISGMRLSEWSSA